MTLRFLNQMFCACGLVLCACMAPGGVADDDIAKGKVIATIGEVAFRDCELSNVEHRRIVQCAEVGVPEDPEIPDGERITLRVVRLAARDGNARAAPLLAIAGGPGQAASEAFLFLDRILRGVARDRDFYLVDQRGTGGSNPQRCDLGDEALMQVEPDAGQIRAVTRQCLAGFDGDPRLYTTSVAIRDLEQVRRMLGVARWHLFGVSYGTRVVQHYLRQHPRVVRTAVMDSVVPATEALGPEIALRSQQALNAFLDRCEADTACRDAFPDISGGLSKLLTRLGEAPESVRFENMRTGGAETMRFTRAHLIGVLRLSLYQSEKLSTLPPMLHQAYAEANFTAWLERHRQSPNRCRRASRSGCIIRWYAPRTCRFLRWISRSKPPLKTPIWEISLCAHWKPPARSGPADAWTRLCACRSRRMCPFCFLAATPTRSRHRPMPRPCLPTCPRPDTW